MRTRFLRGDSAQNNGLTLPNGEITVDLERKALRLHDGSTLGGFECVGTQAVTGPGFGDESAGFYGEVPGTEFISYGDLSAQVGLSAGTLINDTESGWLKFSLDGVVTYVAKKPVRHTVSWEHIYQAGCVYGVDGFGSNPSGGNVDQNTIVTIDGKDYRVSLLKGTNTDPGGEDTATFDPSYTHTSEWNRLMYPIHSGVHTDDRNPSNPSIAYNQWASYSDDDLVVDYRSGNGAYSWCQETIASNTARRVIRGNYGVTIFTRTTATNTNTLFGWRPRLTLVVD